MVGDSRGIMEPYGDLIAIGFCMLGFMVFLMGFSHSLQIHLQQRFMLDQHRFALDLAQALISDPRITQNGKPGLISIPKFENLIRDGELRSEFLGDYPHGFRIQISSPDLDRELSLGEDIRPAINLSIPITLWLDPAHTIPGRINISISR